MTRRVPTALVLLVCLATAYAAWDNVLSDNASVRADAEAIACGRHACGERHGMTKMDRTPLRQTFEFTWQSGVVHVTCARPAWIIGDRTCHVE